MVCPGGVAREVWRPAGHWGFGCGNSPEDHTGVLLSAGCKCSISKVVKDRCFPFQNIKCQRLIDERWYCPLEWSQAVWVRGRYGRHTVKCFFTRDAQWKWVTLSEVCGKKLIRKLRRAEVANTWSTAPLWTTEHSTGTFLLPEMLFLHSIYLMWCFSCHFWSLVWSRLVACENTVLLSWELRVLSFSMSDMRWLQKQEPHLRPQ